MLTGVCACACAIVLRVVYVCQCTALITFVHSLTFITRWSVGRYGAVPIAYITDEQRPNSMKMNPHQDNIRFML